MALDMNKIKARLASFEKKEKKTSKSKDFTWKPTGEHTIRIVPYQYQPDDPFIPLKFHYSFGGTTMNYLSPSSFNKPDPIVELAERLKKNKDTWKQGRDLEPKLRTYVPVIVRGEEEKGVRFWGFGVQIYKQLMETMSEPDYGDITSLTEGYDIKVTFKSKEEVKKDYPETTIMIKPKPRPVIEVGHPKTKEIMELIASKQPNILDIYEPATYETLSAALEDFLKKSSDSQDDSDSNVVLPTEEQVNKAVENQEKSSEVKTSPTAAKAATNADSLTAAFDDIFNS